MKRLYDPKLIEKLKTTRLILIKGPRNSQKSTYISSLIETFSSYHLLDCENRKEKKRLESISKEELFHDFEEKKFVIFKEAQSLKNLQSLVESILFDQTNIKSIVLTCSFDPVLDDDFLSILKNNQAIFTIYPPFFQEIANEIGIVKFDQELEKHLIFGNYLQVLNSENPIEILKQIIDSTIFTQFNQNDRINKEENLQKMLQFMAFKLGEPLSYNEIGYYAGLDNETVERYIDLLERTFILVRIPSFYNGHKYELKKTHIFYFIDNGVRNALINSFNPSDLRIDLEPLWNNWLMAERIKWNSFLEKEVKYFFWRTHTKQQVELIEQSGDEILAYKSLLDKRKKPKFPKSFTEYYPQARTSALNRSTYWAFLSKKK